MGIWVVVIGLLSVDGHLLAITSHAAVHIYIQAFVWTYAFSFVGHIPRSGIAGAYDNSTFNLL